jgi:hypothetical protein
LPGCPNPPRLRLGLPSPDTCSHVPVGARGHFATCRPLCHDRLLSFLEFWHVLRARGEGAPAGDVGAELAQVMAPHDLGIRRPCSTRCGSPTIWRGVEVGPALSEGCERSIRKRCLFRILAWAGRHEFRLPPSPLGPRTQRCTRTKVGNNRQRPPRTPHLLRRFGIVASQFRFPARGYCRIRLAKAQGIRPASNRREGWDIPIVFQ